LAGLGEGVAGAECNAAERSVRGGSVSRVFFFQPELRQQMRVL